MVASRLQHWRDRESQSSTLVVNVSPSLPLCLLPHSPVLCLTSLLLPPIPSPSLPPPLSSPFLPPPLSLPLPSLTLSPLPVPAPDVPPEKSNNNNMDELFSMIQRLASDTLEDQRTSPTPRNTPEPASPATPEQHHHSLSPSGGSLRAPRLSPRSSDSSPETRSKLSNRRRANSTHEKKSLSATRSVGRTVAEQWPAGEGGASEDNSRKFKRTQSGAAISQRNKVAHENLKRSFSPPVSTDRVPSATSPPPPTSRPPPLPSGRQPAPRSARHSGSSHRSSEDLLQGGAHQQPQYFPRAYPTMEREQQPLGLTVTCGSYPERLDSRAQRTGPAYGGRQYAHRSPSSPGNDQGHPLDSFVNEANVMLPSATGHVTTGSTHSRQHSTPVQMTPENYPERGAPLTNYPWHQAHPPNQRR